MPLLTAEQIRQARDIDLLDLLGADVELRRLSAQEYAGPCPFCGGSDRFHVQPEQGRWFCRQCTGDPSSGGWLDAIDYVQRRRGLAFPAAVSYLQGHFQPGRRPRTRIQTASKPWRTVAWQKRAWAETRAARRRLQQTEGAAGAAYLRSRGLLPETWTAWGLGLAHPWHPGRNAPLPALLLPWQMGERLSAVQYRYIVAGLAKRERYSQRAGGERLLFGLPLLRRRDTLILVEGELNAMSLWQVFQQRADVLSWGAQNDLLRAATLTLARRLSRRYARVLVWADEEAMAQRCLQALASHRSKCQRRHALSSPQGRDANDLLRAGDLPAYVAPWLG